MATEILHENNGHGIRAMRTNAMNYSITSKIGTTRTPTNRPQSRTPMTTLTSTTAWRTCTESARTVHEFTVVIVPHFTFHGSSSERIQSSTVIFMGAPLWLVSFSTSTFSSCQSPSSSSTSSCSLSSTTRSSWQTCAAPLQKIIRTPWTPSPLTQGPARGLTGTGPQQPVVGASAALRWCDRLLKRNGLVPVDVTQSYMIATCGGNGTAKVVQVLDFFAGIVWCERSDAILGARGTHVGRWKTTVHSTADANHDYAPAGSKHPHERTNVKFVHHLTQSQNESNLKEWSMIWTMLILLPQTSTLLIRQLCCMCFEDNEAVIKMIIKGRSPTMRHVSRTHRVALDWLFDRINLDSKIQIKYIDTKNQLADI